MKQFPIDSQIDLGTVDIIQSEPQYKRKNSLLYKGILSNLRKKENTDGAFLSTYGNVISTTWNEISSDNYDTTLSNSSLITDKGVYETADTILHARYVNGKLIILQSSESGTNDFILTIKDGDTVTKNKYTALSDSDEQVLAYVLSNGQFCTKGGKLVQIWNISSSGTASYITDSLGNSYFTMPTSGSKFYCAYFTDQYSFNTYIFGTDDVDMRKRSTIRVSLDKNNPTNWNFNDAISAKIIGFGCVSETGLVTGEPIYTDAYYHPNYSHDDEGVEPSEAYPDDFWYSGTDWEGDSGFLFDYTKAFYCDVDSGVRTTEPFTITKTLENGVIQKQMFDPSQSAVAVTNWSEYGQQSSTTTISNSFTKENSNVSESAEQEGTDTKTRNQYLNYSLLSIYTNSGTTSSQKHRPLCISIAMICGFDLGRQDTSDVRVYLLPAMTRVESNMTSYRTSTRISFTDFDSPCGSMDATVEDGTQIFPHIRFFNNDTTKKGYNWDYGRGWSRFIVDSIIVYNGGTNYGQAVLEEPLRLFTLDSYGMRYDTIDVLNKTVANKFISNTNGFPRTTNSQADSAHKFDTEATWATLYNNKPHIVYIYNSNVYDMRARLHRITAQQKTASGTYYYSHNFTGIMENSILSAIPFRTFEAMGYGGHTVTIPIYNGIKTSICFDENLITTPTEMDENYSVQLDTNGWDVRVATWSAGTITYATLSIQVNSDSKIKLEKLSDFIFRTNILNDKNLLVEDRRGNLNLQYGFIGYAMDTVFDCEKSFDLKMPTDGQSYVSNDVYYYGAGVNSGIKEELSSTSFLLPAITISGYCHPDDTAIFTKEILNNRKGLLRAQLLYHDKALVAESLNIQEYWTHTAATTDVLYKDSRYLFNSTVVDTFEDIYKDTSWIPTDELIIYPVGMISRTYGENYVTATVDTGNNYVSRFYNKDNKTFVIFNQNDQVYYGSEIFTIQSGNYYFDNQGIYYLGSQTDYSQNIFTAYALGMEFLANSSSEAYFYSKWDKSIYVFTASNTVQKAFSLADRPYVIDAVYSSQEQCLYILFEDGSLYIKSQLDDCLIEDCNGIQLQTNEKGAFAITEDGFVIYNPYLYDELLPLKLETEWLGDSVAVQKTSYVDIVLYSDEKKEVTLDIDVQMLQNGIVTSDKKTLTVNKSDWKNQLARVRFVPTKENLQGNAVKIVITSDDVSVFAINIEMNPVSQMTATRIR